MLIIKQILGMMSTEYIIQEHFTGGWLKEKVSILFPLMQIVRLVPSANILQYI